MWDRTSQACLLILTGDTGLNIYVEVVDITFPQKPGNMAYFF
jgi:hypothetical protein